MVLLMAISVILEMGFLPCSQDLMVSTDILRSSASFACDSLTDDLLVFNSCMSIIGISFVKIGYIILFLVLKSMGDFVNFVT